MQHFVAPLVIMCAFVLLDIITGFVGAVVQKDVDSSKMRDGLLHKSAFFFVFALAVALETSAQWMELGIDIPAVASVTAYIVVTEIVSILENVTIINPALKGSALLDMFGKHK